MKKKIMSLSDWILVYLGIFHPDEAVELPSVRFWAITLIVIASGIQIKTKKRFRKHILNVEDCYLEMEDLLKEEKDEKS